jgi:hypothetical protein
MRHALAVGAFALCTAAVTAVGGWWTIPVLAAVWVRVLPRDIATATLCALGAASGWALLLAWDAAHGPVGTVARRAGGVFLLPGWAFVGLTLMFGALLASTAAIVAGKSRRR